MSLFARARYYDPVTARFTQEDTYRGDVMDVRSLNLYAYCANDPVNFVDPSGHDAESNINSAFNAWRGGYITYEQYAENVRLNGGVPVSSSWQPPPKEEWHDPVSLMPPSTPEETLGSYKPEDNVVINSNGTPIGINAEGTGNVIDRSDAASSVTNNKNWSSKQWVVGEGYSTSSFDVIVSEVYADEQYGINSLYDLYLLYESGEIDEEERERLLEKLLNESPKLAEVGNPWFDYGDGWVDFTYDNIITGQVIFMQHGLNSDRYAFQSTVAQLKQINKGQKYISLGIITMRGEDRVQIILNDDFINSINFFTDERLPYKERISKTITSLKHVGYNVIIRTEFSSGTLSFEEQRSELKRMVDSVDYRFGNTVAGVGDADVTFIGHSMGGLASINYGIDYAKDNPNIKVTVITVSTPYSANSYADIVQWLPQDAYKELAGRDGALDRLKEKSNGYIYSNNFSVYAISVLADASLPEVEWEAIGDIIVPLSSQKGGEFKGITKMPTITNYNYKSQSHGIGGWDNPYHHVNTPSLSEVVQQIDKIISNTI